MEPLLIMMETHIVSVTLVLLGTSPRGNCLVFCHFVENTSEVICNLVYLFYFICFGCYLKCSSALRKSTFAHVVLSVST